MLSRLAKAHPFPFVGEQQRNFLPHHLQALSEGGTRRQRLSAHPGVDLGKEPRIAERSPPDHHQIAAGLLKHAGGILRGKNIPVADHRHRYRRLDTGDAAEINRRRIHLGTGAAVHRYSSDARGLEPPRRLDSHILSSVIAPADLGCHRNAACALNRRAGDLPGERKVAQQRAARSASGDLRRGTSHIEVDDIRGKQGRGTRRLPDGLRLAAEQLHRIGARLIRFQQNRAFLAVLADSLGAGHLPHRITRPMCAGNLAHRAVGHPGHRRKSGKSLDCYPCDLHHVSDSSGRSFVLITLLVYQKIRRITTAESKKTAAENPRRCEDLSLPLGREMSRRSPHDGPSGWR